MIDIGLKGRQSDERKLDLLYNAEQVTEQYVDVGFSCAETTIRVLRDCFKLEIPDALIMMTSTFRGGVGIGGRCGVIETALCVFSYQVCGGQARSKPLEAFAISLQDAFQQEFTSCQCGVLWDLGLQMNEPDSTRCIILPGVLAAVSVFYDYSHFL